MRLPYTENPPTGLDEVDTAIVERIKARRATGVSAERALGLIPLDRALLHAPKIADGTPPKSSYSKHILISAGWNSLIGSVRGKSSLEASLREIAICRVALINEAWFEWSAHWSMLLDLPGVTEESVAAVAELYPRSKAGLDERQWVVLRYADAMTKDVKVSDSLFDELKSLGFSNQEFVELTVTVGAYNMVSRFLVAMDVGEMNGKRPKVMSKREMMNHLL